MELVQKPEINRDDFNWTEKPIVGMALLIHGGTIDCFKKPINQHVFYEVGLHKISKKAIIIATERNQKTEFINYLMKNANRLN